MNWAISLATTRYKSVGKTMQFLSEIFQDFFYIFALKFNPVRTSEKMHDTDSWDQAIYSLQLSKNFFLIRTSYCKETMEFKTLPSIVFIWFSTLILKTSPTLRTITSEDTIVEDAKQDKRRVPSLRMWLLIQRELLKV